MIWFAWFMLALESLVIAIGLRLMWAMVSEASREPADPTPQVEDPDDPALFTMEEVDERGYVSSRKLHMGCEAAICRIPLGARLVAGRRSLKEPQYAWDYASVPLADKPPRDEWRDSNSGLKRVDLPNPRWSALSGWPSALCSVAV
jgi:hypothetical protein